ncbi:hypothetical protein, partial [Burkholderia cenocepacia]|uniref:hypothetical protein n=1 Tax=Burkholderia cenocepacia TaxID=95486 RepID=UPI001C0E2D95
AGVGGIGRVPSDESPSIVAREKKPGAPIKKPRTRCVPEEKSPSGTNRTGFACMRQRASGAYFTFALITASDTFAGVSA